MPARKTTRSSKRIPPKVTLIRRDEVAAVTEECYVWLDRTNNA
jgi:hypothetical protein